jgi:kinesin family member 2/24
MASSATLTTTHLPHLRSLLREWESQQPTPKGFTTPVTEKYGNSDVYKQDLGGNLKDVVVAFRTRPPLENEADEKFTSVGESGSEEGRGRGREKVDFCSGISVPSAEPGVFVAHVPGMKVRLSHPFRPLLIPIPYDTI